MWVADSGRLGVRLICADGTLRCFGGSGDGVFGRMLMLELYVGR